MRLRRFYETDLFAILYWKIDGGVVDANDGFLRMLGYSREELRAGLLNWAEDYAAGVCGADEDAWRTWKRNRHSSAVRKGVHSQGRRSGFGNHFGRGL